MNMVNLIKAINTFLATKADRAYFQKAPATVAFPYVVFDLPTSYDSRPSEDFTLEVDIWDNNQDTTALETLTENIDGDGNIFNPSGLNNRTITATGVVATFYRESRGVIPDEDKRINRRQLRYRVRAY